jgi:hypothetical protein
MCKEPLVAILFLLALLLLVAVEAVHLIALLVSEMERLVVLVVVRHILAVVELEVVLRHQHKVLLVVMALKVVPTWVAVVVVAQVLLG